MEDQSRRKKRENKMYVEVVRHLAVRRMLPQPRRTTQDLYTKELRGGSSAARQTQVCNVILIKTNFLHEKSEGAGVSWGQQRWWCRR